MKAERVAVVAIAVMILAIWMPLSTRDADAYEQWSINDDATYCGECHGDFRNPDYISLVDGQNWGNLHDLHRNTMLNGDCNVCHIGGNRFPVHLNESNGGNGFPAVSCVGCHGIDPDPGNPNTHWGAGLRRHHLEAGVGPDMNGDTCADCHTSDPVPAPENTPPAYYFTPDSNHPNKPTDPCNPLPTLPENFAGLTIGLDNDGDLDYDGADADCAVDLFSDDFESGDTSAWSGSVP